jgi:hypothetical protein
MRTRSSTKNIRIYEHILREENKLVFGEKDGSLREPDSFYRQGAWKTRFTRRAIYLANGCKL